MLPHYDPMMTEFPLEDRLARMGIETLNDMQQSALAAADTAGDLILLSPTGSGKTLAFLLPLWRRLQSGLSGSVPRCLILSPSRELALQTAGVWKKLDTGFPSVCSYGGHLMADERRILREQNPAVAIGTPGRVSDLIEKGYLDTSGIELLIIDEFDKMLELGFSEIMQKILSLLPNVQKRWLVSATNSPEFPVFVRPDALRLDYRPETDSVLSAQEKVLPVFHVNSLIPDKLAALLSLLASLAGEKDEETYPVMIFVNYREAVERVCDYLKKNRINCSAFHGGMDQNLRERALYRFRSGSSRVLVSTDLAARGLDIPEVRSVVHYHLPLQMELFVHRNGRTTRGDHPVGKAYWISSVQEKLPEYLSVEDYPEYEIRPVKGAMPDGADESEAVYPAVLAKGIPLPEKSTLYIGRGRKDKISRGDVVGFLCKKGGLTAAEIGLIELRDHHAYAAIPRKRVQDVLARLRGEKIKSQRTLIEEAK